jgi:hypothetical protein
VSRLLIFHLLLLILLPVIWYMMRHSTWHLPGPAGTEALGSPLSDVEQDYYDTIFAYTMQNVAADQSYHWQVGRSSGDITVGQTFVSKSRAFCRSYAESYIINGLKGTAQGYACRRSGDEDSPSWCKLREGDALTCAMEHRGLFE